MIKLTISEPHILALRRKQLACTAHEKFKHEGSPMKMVKPPSGKYYGHLLGLSGWKCPLQGLLKEST